MNKLKKHSYYLRAFLLLTLSILSGCARLDGRHPPDSSWDRYDNRYDRRYDGRYSRNDDYYRRHSWEVEHERAQLERERERAEEARRRLIEERARRERYIPPAARYSDRCPAGFFPREQSCTREERKRGCKDIRLPSGKGCVNP